LLEGGDKLCQKLASTLPKQAGAGNPVPLAPPQFVAGFNMNFSPPRPQMVAMMQIRPPPMIRNAPPPLPPRPIMHLNQYHNVQPQNQGNNRLKKRNRHG
jgi:hypothetical protein